MFIPKGAKMCKLTIFITICLVVVSATAQESPTRDVVVVCPINGMIDDGVAVLVARAVREAAGAKAIIFEVDTPGGLVDSAIQITKSIDAAPCPTVAYIKGMGAISAGALISFSCKSMVMAPDTNIGAATPVTITAEGMLPTGEKEVSFMRAKMRALAEHNGYNPAVAEAMVDKDIELRGRPKADGTLEIFSVYREPKTSLADVAQKVVSDPEEFLKKLIEGQTKAPAPAESPKDKAPNQPVLTPEAPKTGSDSPFPGSEVLKPSGKLLTLTPSEALRYGLIRETVLSRSQLMGVYGWNEVQTHAIEMTWSEALFRWLRNPLVAGLLLMFGVAGIYIEIKTPGVVLPGVLGGICLALFFGAHFLIGASDWIGVALVVTGIVLILSEIFVFPGTLLLGGIGILCVLGGIFFALTNVIIPQYSWDYARLNNACLTLVVAAASLTIFIAAAWRFLPKTPIYRAIVQTHAQQSEAGYTVQTDQEEAAALGLEGVAASMLRPAGRGIFGGKFYSVMTRGEFIAEGDPIVIIQVDENRYIVAKQGDNAKS